ncbi:hypothetical protein CRE_25886 [Caenorhabditis remanei]|uniref:DNA2/NAM7 helicase-like C-terminal domain-containing protein n=1 Tax=Caenorhabditis remanei TaxID=31234 RepID=E3NGE4_CAERE|nr:hypothetical protein CRE_25886 [Caenorhabditis remanei]
MSQLRQVADPLRRFSFCYGSTDRSENKHIVPTISSVLAHREQFKQPENSSQHLKRAASMKQQHMEVFASRWAHETGSMIYVIVKTGSNYAIGSPLCVETGLYKEYEHLRSVSFNSSSKDVKNLKLRDRHHQPFSFASSLVIGDLVVVLKTGFVEHIERKTNQPSYVAKLTTHDVNNYMPYKPVPLIACCSLLNSLHECLSSREGFVTLNALKALRSAKLQSGVSNFQDCRFIDTTVAGWDITEGGSLHVELRTTAAISVATFGVGTIVKLHAVTTEPIIGKIVKNFLDEKEKILTVVVNECCGVMEGVEDDFNDNIMLKSQYEWRIVKNLITQVGKSIPLTKMDFHHSYDTLMSGEKRMVRNELSDFLVEGLVASSRAMFKKLDPPNLNPVVPLEQLYGADASTTETLSTYQLLPFNQALKRDSSHEERVFYQAFLNKNIMVHLHESPVGSGKTTVLAAAVKARLIVDQNSRIALTAMTNSAVIALLNAFEFPLDYCDEKLRPLVVQSKNWKHANGVSSHSFDWKFVMKKCFIEELVKFDIHKPVSDESRYSKIKSMLSYVRNNSIIALSSKLGKEKYDFISKLICPMLNKQELVNHFFHLYKPNLIIATMDSLVNFTSFLPVDHMPNLIAIDECTMIQPSDLCLFSSKMQSMSFESIEFVLIGDHKQLTPFNCIQPLSPLTITPNVLLMNNAAFTTRFTVVHRCHNNATELVSSVFYGGYLTSGKDPNQSYIQHRLKGVPFRNPKVKAYSFVGNNYASCAVAQSRCNSSEASAIAEYAQKLIDVDHINPSQISVITPFLAQAELLQKLVPGGITCSTSRKYQGLENDIVLFSCCHTGGKQGSIDSEDEMHSEGFRVQTSNTGIVKCKLIDDDAIILVSLTRSRHFTTIFGNETFLRTIPRWNAILNGILQ